MKLNSLCILFILSALIATSQTLPSKSDNYHLVGTKKEVLTYKEIIGTPYIYDQFLNSKVYLKSNNTPIEYKINYNAYKDQLEYLENHAKYVVTNPEQILKIEINNQVLIYTDYYNYDVLKQGYFIEIISDYISLCKREIISSRSLDNYAYNNNQDKKAKFISERTMYYLSIYGEPLILIKTKKNLLKLFFNHPKVEEYIKKERIKLHSEEDLKTLVSFLNNIDKSR